MEHGSSGTDDDVADFEALKNRENAGEVGAHGHGWTGHTDVPTPMAGTTMDTRLVVLEPRDEAFFFVVP